MITIICGGQYGSEGKGEIVAEWCREKYHDICARTGGPNSGHTVHHEGHKLVTRQLPAGWVNPNTKLIIGAGAIVDTEHLLREVEEAGKITKEGNTIWSRIRIDERAWPLFLKDRDNSEADVRHLRFGSTGKGCGPAAVARINRREDRLIRTELDGRVPVGTICDTEILLNDSVSRGADLVIEGTQGALLDLYLSRRPYSTHRSTGPATWLAELGLSPTVAPMQVIMVLRTHPIRVAGNSGPMGREITWLQLAERVATFKAAHSRRVPIKAGHIRELREAVIDGARDFNLDPAFILNPRVHSHEADFSRFCRDEAEIMLTFWGECIDSLSDEAKTAWNKFVERTTVTKNVRRIGDLNYYETYRAARQLAPTTLAVTFMDYQFEKGQTSTQDLMSDLHRWTGARPGMLSWGPGEIEWLL